MDSEAEKAEYKFPDLISESQAVSGGFNLTEKVTHAIYRKVQQCSNLPSARRNIYFSVTTIEVEGMGTIPRRDVVSILKRFVKERLVLQMLRFEYTTDTKQLILVPFLLSKTAEKSEIKQIYLEAVAQSANAFEGFMRGKPVSKTDAVDDLEYDLAASKDFSKSVLKSFITFESLVNIRQFDIIPDGDLIRATLGDIRQDLIESSRAIDIPAYGLLGLVDLDLISRFELAGDFLIDSVIPKHRTKGNCKRELEQIAVEEATYQLDDFAPVTPDFLVRRAEEVKKAVQNESNKPSDGRFPGALATQTVISLSNIAKQKYLELARLDNDRVFAEYKKRLLNFNSSWEDAILFIDQKEMTQMNPVMWNRLVADPDLIYGIWELPDTSMHIFVARRPAAFRKLVTGIASSIVAKEWQILALRDLIENYEDYFKELFRDPAFVETYGSLLRRSYIPYMPWYLQILLVFSIKPLLNLAFQSAKRRIIKVQEVLKTRNYNKYLAAIKEREAERFNKRQQLQRLTLSNKIIERLDLHYFQEGHIPTIGNIRAELPNLSDEEFDQVIKSERFQTISLRRADKKDERILLYPLDSNWKIKSARVDLVLAAAAEKRAGKEDDDFNRKELEKIASLRRIIEKGPTIPQAIITESDDDPYIRLEKEIRKHKARKMAEEEFDF